VGPRRPVTKAKIKQALKKGGWDFVSRKNNTLRALQQSRGEFADLSGFKVNSFTQNLLGNLEEVTNDAWMVAFGDIDQSVFKGPAGYFAMNAKVRSVANRLGWKPAEVQETIWSFVKTISALRAGGYTGRRALERATHESVAAMPEFTAALLESDDVRQRLDAIGIDIPTDRIAGAETGRSGAIEADRPRVLGRVAGQSSEPTGGQGVPQAVEQALFQLKARPKGSYVAVSEEDGKAVIRAFESGGGGAPPGNGVGFGLGPTMTRSPRLMTPSRKPSTPPSGFAS
jgi:hypothetical protein